MCPLLCIQFHYDKERCMDLELTIHRWADVLQKGCRN